MAYLNQMFEDTGGGNYSGGGLASIGMPTATAPKVADPYSAPMATTQQQPSTPAMQDWYDIQGTMFPRFNASDLSWNPYQQQGGFGDSQENFNWGAGEIGLQNAGNYGHFSNLAGNTLMNNNYAISGADKANPFSGDNFNLNVKTGKLAGKNVKYMRQGDSWVPVPETAADTHWSNTNAGIMQYAPLLAAGGMAAAPLIAGAVGAGAAGGMAAGEGAMIGSGLSGVGDLAAGGAAAAGGAGSAAPWMAGSQVGTAGLPVSTAGAGFTAAPAGGAALGGTLASGGVTAAGALSPSVLELISKGMNVQDAMKAVGGASQLAGGAQQQAPAGGGAGGGMSGLDGLLNLFGGAYSANRNRDYAEQLKKMFEDRKGIQDQYQGRLNETYTNPNAYLESPEYQALAKVRGNQVIRQDSKNWSSDADRELLMQEHAQKGLQSYREGLLGSIKANDPAAYADSMAKGALFDAFSNQAIFGALGQMGGAQTGTGTAGQVGNIVRTITGAAGDIGSIWDSIKDWF